MTAVIETLSTLGKAQLPAQLARWLDALVSSLDEIGVARGFAADSAGEQLLELLERLRLELEHEALAIPYAEWRRWLARELETAAFRDRAIESPVVFTHLGAAALRRFDATWGALPPEERAHVRTIHLDSRTRPDRVTVSLAEPGTR